MPVENEATTIFIYIRNDNILNIYYEDWLGLKRLRTLSKVHMCRTSTTWSLMSPNHLTQCKESYKQKNLPNVHYHQHFLKVMAMSEVGLRHLSRWRQVHCSANIPFSPLKFCVCSLCCPCLCHRLNLLQEFLIKAVYHLSASSPRAVPSTGGAGPADVSPGGPPSNGIPSRCSLLSYSH